MKKVQVISITVLMICIAVLMMWRFAGSFPDWLVRAAGVLMLGSIFTTVFSTAKMSAKKK